MQQPSGLAMRKQESSYGEGGGARRQSPAEFEGIHQQKTTKNNKGQPGDIHGGPSNVSSNKITNNNMNSGSKAAAQA